MPAGRIGGIGGVQAPASRRAVLGGTPTAVSWLSRRVWIHPGPSPACDSRHVASPVGSRGRSNGAEHLEAIRTNLCSRGRAPGCTGRHAGCRTALARAFDPVGGALWAQPVGGPYGASVQRGTEGFADTCQAVAGPDGRAPRGRIGPDPAASVQTATLRPAVQDSRKEHWRGLAGHQPCAQLGADRRMEARGGAISAQSVRPVHATAPRVGRGPSRYVCGKLPHGEAGQPPRGCGGLAARRLEGLERGMVVNGPKRIAHGPKAGAVGQSGPCDPGGLRRDTSARR
jgi:hypothetical protein